MATKKESIIEEPKSLWNQELVKPIPMRQYSKDIADTEKIIVFGESNTGKTSFYISVLAYLKKQGLKKDDLMMCIVFPDRPTGLTKLLNAIPPEYLDNIFIFPINNYEELVSSTAVAEKKLEEHYKKTGKLGWLVNELLSEDWMMAQDYYCRLAYGETLGEYFAKKRADIKAMKEDSSAYSSLQGWSDWPIIKFAHNYNWMDKIKRMPYNVIFTAELKEEGNKDSLFYDLGYRPSGEKDSIHRVDTVIYLSHKGNNFYMKVFKLTGYKVLYNEVDITNKNAYFAHKEAQKQLEKRGYRTSIMEDLEKEAGIIPPKPKEEKPKIEISMNKQEPEKEAKTEEPKKEEQWNF